MLLIACIKDHVILVTLIPNFKSEFLMCYLAKVAKYFSDQPSFAIHAHTVYFFTGIVLPCMMLNVDFSL